MEASLSYYHNACAVPLIHTTFHGEFSKSASRFPEKECIIVYDEENVRGSLTYTEVDKKSDILARALMSLGIKKGDVLAIILPNSTEFVVIQLALHKAGCPALMMNENQPEYHDGALDDLKCVGLFCEQRNVEGTGWEITFRKHPRSTSETVSLLRLLEIGSRQENEGQQLPKVDMDDTAVILLTSGTTGKPKAVSRCHGTINTAILNGPNHFMGFPVNNCTRLFSERSMAYSGGVLYGTLNMFCGCPNVIVNSKTLSDEKRIARIVHVLTIEKCEVAVLLGNLLNEILGLNKIQFADLKLILTAGQPINDEIITRVKNKIPNAFLTDAYAITETFYISMINPHDTNTTPVSSIVVPHVEVKVISQDGMLVPFLTAGEICVRSHTVFAGYLDSENKNKPSPLKDGWYHTGDMGFLSQDGHLTVLGRMDDIIKVATVAIPPVFVEKYFQKLSSVRTCVAVGVPDQRTGEAVCACVTLEEDKTMTADVFNKWWTDESKAGRIPIEVPKPKYFWITGNIPTNESNKIDRLALKILASQYILNI